MPLKENSTQLSCVGQWLKVYFDVIDSRVPNAIDSVEYRCNLACVSLFYRYYNGFCSSKRGLICRIHVFLCNIRLPWQAHSYVVDWLVDRTLSDRQNLSDYSYVELQSCRNCNFLAFQWWKTHKIQNNHQNIMNHS